MQSSYGKRAPRYPLPMARWLLSCGLLFLLALPVAGHPAFVPVDPPAALVQADPGRTTFTLCVDSAEWFATVSRSVSDACDVALVLGSQCPLELRARVLLPTPFPLRSEMELGRSRIAVMAALWLGPVRLVGTRSWGSDVPVRIASYASDTRFVAAAGVEIDGRWRPFVSATWCPDAVPLWTVSLTATSDGLRLSIGGTW